MSFTSTVLLSDEDEDDGVTKRFFALFGELVEFGSPHW